MAIAEITVFGAGVLGLSVAFCCARHGAKVQVIDPNGVASGASGGVVGALAPHTPDNWNPKKAFQFESLMMAEKFWADVQQIGGVQTGYGRHGRLQPILSDRQLELAHIRAENAKELWQGKATWTVCSANEIGEWCPPSPTGFVVYDTLSGCIHPRRATQALAAAVEAMGGVIRNSGSPCGTIVSATGVAGLRDLSVELEKPIGKGVKGQGAVLDFDARGRSQLFADGIHIVPHASGTVGIGSTSENEFSDATVVDEKLETTIEKARDLFPVLRDAPVIERWANVRPRAKSRAPMLGRHPLRPDEFIVNGGFKIGFGMAPKIGFVMAELILNGVDDIPEPFAVAASL